MSPHAAPVPRFVGAGTCTLAARLAQAPGTILVAQDHRMVALYPLELRSVAHDARLTPRLRAAMGPHLAALLRTGLSVALDWPANMRASRDWMRGIIEAAGCAHRYVLHVPVEVCLEPLAMCSAGGRHEYVVGREEFDAISG